MIRPFIAIPAVRPGPTATLRQFGLRVADKINMICEAAFRAGGDPFLLPPGDFVASRLRYAHGAIIPGGADLEPITYGQPRDDRTGDSDPIQDSYDISFVKTLIDNTIPFLAICRGMQVLNVACGGTLIQHLPETAIAHWQAEHSVTVTPDCAIARAAGRQEFKVSSIHHQAIDRLGDELRVVGRADDGCIEAVEHATAPALAVQWHPEDDAATTAHQQSLFDFIVEAAHQRQS